MAVSRCPACKEVVALRGATCNEACYRRIYLYAEQSGGRLHLDDDTDPPLDYTLQPWYRREVR